MNTTEATDSNSIESDGEADDSSPSLFNNESLEENEEEFSILELRSSSSRRPLSRLSQERRMRILFGLLFYQVQRQNRSSTNDELPADIQPPNRDLRILSQKEAIAQKVVCRFCLGQAGDEDESPNNLNPFVSPCNCSGGSEWVHLKCFRRWQCQAASSSSTLSASKVCSVCRCAYLLPPLSMNDDSIKAGALLVYMDDEESRPSSFQKSLVLIVDHSVHGTTGLIVNIPLSPEDLEEGMEEHALGRHEILWRKGGPVCGGRLGITRYILAHTFDDPLEADHGDEPLISHNITTEQATEQQDSNLPNKLQFVYDRRNMQCPATFRGHELGDIMKALTETNTPTGEIEAPVERISSEVISGAFYVFAGYCKWRGGQLASELQRGVWSVCNGASPDEMLQEQSWNRLRNFSDRMLSYEDLIQEDAAVLGIMEGHGDQDDI